MLIYRLSNKYPEFYKRERYQIITSVSFILASILMRIVEYGLFSMKSVKEALEESYKNNPWLYPIILLVLGATTTIMQTSAVLF